MGLDNLSFYYVLKTNVKLHVSLYINRNVPVAALPVTQQMTEMSISREEKVTPKTETEPGMFAVYHWWLERLMAYCFLKRHFPLSWAAVKVVLKDAFWVLSLWNQEKWPVLEYIFLSVFDVSNKEVHAYEGSFGFQGFVYLFIFKVRHSEIAWWQGGKFWSQSVEISVYNLAVQLLLTHGSQNVLLRLESGVLMNSILQRNESVGGGNTWFKNTNKTVKGSWNWVISRYNQSIVL